MLMLLMLLSAELKNPNPLPSSAGKIRAVIVRSPPLPKISTEDTSIKI